MNYSFQTTLAAAAPLVVIHYDDGPWTVQIYISCGTMHLSPKLWELPTFLSPSPLEWPISGLKQSQRRAGAMTVSSRHVTQAASGKSVDLELSQSAETGSILRRIDITGLGPSEVRSLVDFSQPVILSGVLPGRKCELWCEALMEDLADEYVDFQIRSNADCRSEVFRESLGDFVGGLQEESTHDNSW